MKLDWDSLLNGQNAGFIEDLYAEYLRDPSSVDPDWSIYFDSLPQEEVTLEDLQGPRLSPPSLFRSGGHSSVTLNEETPKKSERESGSTLAVRQDKVDQLIRSYRVRGHRIARLDPLGLHQEHHPELEASYFDLTEADLDQRFSTRTLASDEPEMTLREVIERLRRTYCGYIGVQFMHIDDVEPKDWLQRRMESTQNQKSLSREEQLRVLTKLIDAEGFEQFIHKKFLGAKRFSLEGGESLIPLIDQALEKAGEHRIEEAVIAMAHRGRLNILANIMGKSPAQIFHEFADSDPERFLGGGDVKYHMGYSYDHTTSAQHRIHLSLCFNPSHLEFVNPVLLGRVRAKQDRLKDVSRDRVLPILIHGDAAFVGQGIVQETLNLSQLKGYSVGGTIHIIVNNQIGFTTPPESSRSSTYSSDVAKMLQIPVFHVNGERPEAVSQVIELAMDFRRTFKRDVIIDMYCYRRYGHNEGDEPAFTQPVMYNAIRQRKSVRENFTANVIALGDITLDEANMVVKARREKLNQAYSEAKSEGFQYTLDYGRGLWRTFKGGLSAQATIAQTALTSDAVPSILTNLSEVPVGFNVHRTLQKILDRRLSFATEGALDWGAGEAVAFASLLLDRVNIRLSGQDSGRGTFSHRHSVWHDSETGEQYVPLNHLSPVQGFFEVIDSPLSESGVLGFDYGYSLDSPDSLVIWEAQFGDFVNSAQVIIDQFIVSSEDKWNRFSGLVMLLPHGFEGQGPEHSSARLERFLSLCAEDNIQVCNLSTPAQLFHCLRRQILRSLRKPLVIMTPKSLLRHPKAVSTLNDFTDLKFQAIIPDPKTATMSAQRVIFCSGKVYYELLEARDRLLQEGDSVLIHRIEQLYPLDEDLDIAPTLSTLPEGAEVTWVQEEPLNQGAWPHWRLCFGEHIAGHPLKGIGRPASASPATGSAASHRIEQETLLRSAFGLDPE
jgi:2-oxoglutarate dehydrogenase E1 component